LGGETAEAVWEDGVKVFNLLRSRVEEVVCSCRGVWFIGKTESLERAQQDKQCAVPWSSVGFGLLSGLSSEGVLSALLSGG
jgi:hypothetical protein